MKNSSFKEDQRSSVLIVAAETSSSLYAQRLLEQWQREGTNVAAFGVGSRDMEKLGFEVLGRSEDLAVVGLTEVIKHWGTIKQTFKSLVSEAQRRRPKVALLLDYPDFNLRLAKKLKKLGIPVVYYISPQVWAWRQGRVKLIKKVVDKVLVLFPFEETFYRQHQVPVEFVGHPLLDELSENYFDHDYRQRHRQRYGLQESDLVLALMPGSRRSELGHHLSVQLKVAQKLQNEFSQLKVVLLVAPQFELEYVRSQLPPLDFSLRLIQDDPFEMIHVADVVLCASGTATLMVGLLEKPMVIMYRMSSVTAGLAKRFVKSTRFFGMINLILNDEVAPEFFQEQANVETLASTIQAFLVDPQKREETATRLREAKSLLGDRGATERVAKTLKTYLEAR